MAVDMYLKIQCKAAGLIAGESVATDHVGEIEILDFTHSLKVPTALGGGGESTGRRSYTDVRVVKAVDTATPAILSALTRNDQITSAVISVRKAGAKPWLYYRMELKDGRISTYENAGSGRSLERPLGGELSNSGMTEIIGIAFASIEIDYRPQNADGTLGGTTTFIDTFRLPT